MKFFSPKPYYQGNRSDHFDGEKFFFPYKPFRHSLIDVIKWRFCHRPAWPKFVDLKPVDKPINKIEQQIRITYIGHASLLIQGGGINILTDPHFSLRASPFSWWGPRRITPPGLSLAHLPKIDLIFISHNHYDHLDLPSLKFLVDHHSPLIVTPLGNEKIIQPVCPLAQIKVLDWHESLTVSPNLSLQLFPAQHWSARTLFDRNSALWGSVCLNINQKSIFFMGDSGFDGHFFQILKKMINKKLELAILPIGSYDPRWFMSNSHMSPEEAWEAFKILGSKYLLPIHYDVFQLGNEPYGEALTRLTQVSGASSQKILPLAVGESFNLGC